MKISLLYYIAFVSLIAGLASGCKKGNDKYFPDPYAGGKAPLGILFSDALPTPNIGGPGEKVTYMVKGLLPYKDTMHFFLNGEPAVVAGVTDSTLTIIVPATASSGTGWVSIGNQIFPSPLFRVSGKVKMDNTFKAGTGTDGTIYQLIPTSDNRFLLTGNFRLYNSNGQGNWLNGIAKIEKHGQFVTDMTTDSAAGRNGSLLSAAELSDGRFLLTGNFSTFGYKKNLQNIARVNAFGKIDTVVQTVIPDESSYNPDGGGPDLSEVNSRDTVSAFNGGTLSSARRVFVMNGKAYFLGAMGRYTQTFYLGSTRTTKVLDYRTVNTVMRTDLDGNLDSSYHYDLSQHVGYDGADGGVNDGLLMPDGKMIVIGFFAKFDKTPVGNIVRLDANGKVDPSFNSGIGADGRISSITYNPSTQKILITGDFKTYKGQSCNGVMLLNADGSPVTGFTTETFSGGSPNYALQLKNGLIVVSGSFIKFGSRTRNGMLVLNADGTLAGAYNNTGALNGGVMGMLETTSAEGETAVIIYGSIRSFDNVNVGNIFRIVLAK
ncbi:beta-propeller uncharacterized protein DUF5122 [Chitinophaga dinghuensis]|uniref:Beta-propeller uncharacterized protein DUF5122 n=1 Tax=Chitinophaga dinghuensis TaxID=1539050 RepID=A0A327W1V8_9BACT|nr:DUF5008 domain-containing protein [Chitinophaga dinghuensis]RAJ82014.1 beta-propeller uncharacterized protein DUF5122 [Chitinophaga dinghuensis]